MVSAKNRKTIMRKAPLWLLDGLFVSVRILLYTAQILRENVQMYLNTIVNDQRKLEIISHYRILCAVVFGGTDQPAALRK